MDNMDNNKEDMAVGVYLDIEKAFDCLKYKSQYFTLKYYGIREVA